MRKIASLSIAVFATFALAGAASATLTATVQGSNIPGTNVYTIVLHFDTADNISGYAVSVTTTGTYTGAFTDTFPAFFPGDLPGPNVTPGSTGVAGSWAATTAGGQTGATFTVGTVTITVGAYGTVKPYFRAGIDGFVDATSFNTLLPDPANVTGVTMVPEPTTGALFGLGLVGLFVARRRSRA